MREHDDEMAWQQREITGSTVLLCEQCGLPLGDNVVTLADSTTPLNEPLDGQRICADCWNKIGRGEVEPDWDEEEDLVPTV